MYNLAEDLYSNQQLTDVVKLACKLVYLTNFLYLVNYPCLP
jgi:hypothetical protein